MENVQRTKVIFEPKHKMQFRMQIVNMEYAI